MIGVFDSGIGGLSVLDLIEQELPGVSTLYVADHAFSPYGRRTVDELAERTAGITQWLSDQGASMVVVACNTATVMVIGELRRRFPQLTIVGMEPAVKPAARAAKNIVVLGTHNTITNDHYRTLCERHQEGRTFWHVAAPELVAQVEAGEFDQTGHLQRLMGEAVANGAEAVVIGCTHFSWLVPTIQGLWPHLHVLDGRFGTVARVRSLYAGPQGQAVRRYVTTGAARQCNLPQRCIHLDPSPF